MIASRVTSRSSTPSPAAPSWLGQKVGSLRIVPVETCDIFFGAEGNFVRIPYGADNGQWQYTIENAAEWAPSATVKITIKTTASPGMRYFIKVVLVNGVSD